MRQGKQNQYGKIEYMGYMRNLDPVLCLLSALAFYFFNRWARHGAQPFPSFRQPEDYYGYYVFPGSVRVPERPLSYATQLDWSRKMFRGGGDSCKGEDPQPSQAERQVRGNPRRPGSADQAHRTLEYRRHDGGLPICLARLCGRSRAFRNEATPISSPARRRYPTRPSVHGSGPK